MLARAGLEKELQHLQGASASANGRSEPYGPAGRGARRTPAARTPEEYRLTDTESRSGWEELSQTQTSMGPSTPRS